MKRILMGILGVVLIAGALSTTSCKKGDEGPAGPKGDSAMANVYYSAWTQLPEASWFVTSQTADYFYADLTAAKLTKNIIDSGSFHVYWNVNTTASPAVYPLPYSVDSNYVNFAATVGKFRIFANIPDAVSNYFTASTGYYRYILIPGGVKLAARNAGVNWNNYSEVKAYLSLKD